MHEPGVRSSFPFILHPSVELCMTLSPCLQTWRLKSHQREIKAKKVLKAQVVDNIGATAMWCMHDLGWKAQELPSWIYVPRTKNMEGYKVSCMYDYKSKRAGMDRHTSRTRNMEGYKVSCMNDLLGWTGRYSI